MPVKLDEVRKALFLMKKKGYLDRRTRLGEEYWVDSKRVKLLLRKGKTRKQISEILDEEYKKEEDLQDD